MNHTTGVQRRNAKMFAIFERAKNEGRGLGGSLDKALMAKKNQL